jgi:hypothetical protein
LALAQIIGHVDKVQFMLHVGAFNDLSKPYTLNSSVARKVQDHGNPTGQEVLDVEGQRTSQTGGVLDEILDAQNLTRVKSIEELVLTQEQRILRLRQLPSVS